MATMTAAHLLREYLKEDTGCRITGGAGTDRLLVQVGDSYKTNVVVQVDGASVTMGLWTVNKNKSITAWCLKWSRRLTDKKFDIHHPNSFPGILEALKDIIADYERSGLSA